MTALVVSEEGTGVGISFVLGKMGRVEDVRQICEIPTVAQ
jgi:hypothetical protein